MPSTLSAVALALGGLRDGILAHAVWLLPIAVVAASVLIPGGVGALLAFARTAVGRICIACTLAAVLGWEGRAYVDGVVLEASWHAGFCHCSGSILLDAFVVELGGPLGDSPPETGQREKAVLLREAIAGSVDAAVVVTDEGVWMGYFEKGGGLGVCGHGGATSEGSLEDVPKACWVFQSKIHRDSFAASRAHV